MFNQTAAIIGPGALALPYAIGCFGVVAGCLMLGLSALTSYYTGMRLLLSSHEITPAQHGVMQ